MTTWKIGKDAVEKKAQTKQNSNIKTVKKAAAIVTCATQILTFSYKCSYLIQPEIIWNFYDFSVYWMGALTIHGLVNA